jgi:hypothetical protein
MIADGDRTARQAEVDGAGQRLWLRVCAVSCRLCALVPLAV